MPQLAGALGTRRGFTAPRRLCGSRLTLAALLGVLVTFLAQGAVIGETGQVRLALLPVGQPGSFFDLTMLPGEARLLSVDIANDGAAALTARTYAADVYTIINGGFGASLRDELQTGTTRWLDYSTDTLQLAPGDRVRRSFSVLVPADAGPGEYIASLILENDQPFQGGDAIGLNQVVRQAVAVVVTVPGQRAPGLAIGAATHKVVGGRSVVSVAVRNTGNVRTKPLVGFELVDSGGHRVSQTTLQMDTFYVHTATFIEVPLAALLLPGTYTVRLTLDDTVEGVDVAEVVIPLIVEATAGSGEAGSPGPGLTEVIQTAPIGAMAALAIVLTAGLLLVAGFATLIRLRRGRRRLRTSER